MKHDKRLIFFPALLIAYEIAVYFSMDIYMPALPQIAKSFSVSSNTAQLTAVLWMFGAFVLQIFIGPLSDRYGRRPILLMGGIFYVISCLLCAAAPNMHILLIARMLQGMTMPTMYIAGYAAINELFDSQAAIKVLARMNSVTIVAPAFGPLLGGVLLSYMNWHGLFVLLAIFAAICIVALWFFMPETYSQEKRLTQLNVVAIAKEYGTILRNLKFISLCLVTFFPIVGLVAWNIAGPFIVIQQFHWSTVAFGVVQIFIFGSFILGTKLVAKYASKERNFILIKTGLILGVFAAILATAVSLLYPNALLIVLGVLMFLTFASGLTMPILSRLSIDASDAAMGSRVTIFSFIRVGSGFLGSVCVTIFYNNTLYSMTTVMLCFSLFAGLLMMLIMQKD